MSFQINHHGDRHKDKGNYADDSGGSRSDKGITAVRGEVNTHSGNTVYRAVGKNRRDTAFGLQGDVGHEHTHHGAG